MPLEPRTLVADRPKDEDVARFDADNEADEVRIRMPPHPLDNEFARLHVSYVRLPLGDVGHHVIIAQPSKLSPVRHEHEKSVTSEG